MISKEGVLEELGNLVLDNPILYNMEQGKCASNNIPGSRVRGDDVEAYDVRYANSNYVV